MKMSRGRKVIKSKVHAVPQPEDAMYMSQALPLNRSLCYLDNTEIPARDRSCLTDLQVNA